MSTTTVERTSVFGARKTRALELATRFDFAAEPLRFYASLIDAQGPAHERALSARPALAHLPEFVVRESLPGIMQAAMTDGTEALREAVLTRFHSADVESIVRAALRARSRCDRRFWRRMAVAGPRGDVTLGRDRGSRTDDRVAPGVGGCHSSPCSRTRARRLWQVSCLCVVACGRMDLRGMTA